VKCSSNLPNAVERERGLYVNRREGLERKTNFWEEEYVFWKSLLKVIF